VVNEVTSKRRKKASHVRRGPYLGLWKRQVWKTGRRLYFFCHFPPPLFFLLFFLYNLGAWVWLALAVML
jgi:hypothetical protein